jgi:multidrug efflux pump subunit AcrA (membrane-fusion protein)
MYTRPAQRRIDRYLALLPVIGLLMALPVAAQQGRPALVEVAPVIQQSIAQPVTFVGTVEPPRRSRVASEVEGIVAEVQVEEGQHVRQNDILVRLRQERLEIDLQNRRASARRYQNELAELRNGTRPEVIEETRAAAEEAEAEVAQAERELRRQQGLSERGVAALRTREDAATALQVARQRLVQARARYAVAKRGPRSERVAQAEAQYQAAQAEVERLEYDLERTRVRAPFSGFVVEKHTEIGQWLGRGDPVVTLIELSKAHITVPIPERYIPHVHLGKAAEVQVDALPGTVWQGTLIRLVPEAHEARTFPVTVEVENPEVRLKSGFVARVTLTVGQQRNALMVPKDAIVTQGPRHIVYAVRDGKATPLPVERHMFYEGFAVISGPLKPGEQVVVRGNERLRPGQPVQLAGAGSN